MVVNRTDGGTLPFGTSSNLASQFRDPDVSNLIPEPNLSRATELVLELMKIPGIGTYTAASISAILYDSTKAVVDGNIKRILSRVMRLNPANKTFEKKLSTVAQNLTPKKNNGSYCQALMDLGSLICRPKNPLCKKCPVSKQRVDSPKVGGATEDEFVMQCTPLPRRQGKNFQRVGLSGARVGESLPL